MNKLNQDQLSMWQSIYFWLAISMVFVTSIVNLLYFVITSQTNIYFPSGVIDMLITAILLFLFFYFIKKYKRITKLIKF